MKQSIHNHLVLDIIRLKFNVAAPFKTYFLHLQHLRQGKYNQIPEGEFLLNLEVANSLFEILRSDTRTDESLTIDAEYLASMNQGQYYVDDFDEEAELFQIPSTIIDELIEIMRRADDSLAETK